MSPYKCDWCSKEIRLEEFLFSLAIFQLQQGPKSGNVVPYESYFEDLSHELTFHKNCWISNTHRAVLPFEKINYGHCSWCLGDFLRGDRFVQVSQFQVVIGRKSGIHSLLPMPFPDGIRDKLLHYGCLEQNADPTILGIDPYAAERL